MEGCLGKDIISLIQLFRDEDLDLEGEEDEDDDLELL